MALLQNGFRYASSGVRIFGATASNNAYPSALIGNWDKIACKRNLTAGEGISSDLAGVPSGYTNKYTFVMPQKAGGIKSFRESEGAATVSGAMAAGKNAQGSADGAATVTGTAQLVVSGTGSAAGAATVAGNVNAALGAVGSVAGAASTTATIGALAWGVGSSNGVATATAVRYATGELVGSIAPAVTLDAANFSAYLLDEEDIETGMTLRQALRLIAAATGGKVSGGGTTTITFRNAVADSEDRIVATVDSNGNRSAIAYDLA